MNVLEPVIVNLLTLLGALIIVAVATWWFNEFMYRDNERRRNEMRKNFEEHRDRVKRILAERGDK